MRDGDASTLNVIAVTADDGRLATTAPYFCLVMLFGEELNFTCKHSDHSI